MKKLFILVSVIALTFSVFAYSGTTIGPEVSELNGKKLQWEAGSFDYFVMFKSLMSNTVRQECTDTSSPVGCDLPGNPEPDTCLQQSSFKLTNQHVPEDAFVEAAYLVWTTTIDPTNPNFTDNTATLNFVSDDGSINETINVVAPRVGTPGTDTNPGLQDFTFEGIALDTQHGYYTYRVDVTDLFYTIHNKGRDNGYKSDGLSLYGNYTVSDVTCTNNADYISQVSGNSIYSSTVMCGWSLITVYRSTKVSAKMVYIYNGFGQYAGQNVDLGISGFEFPDKPIIKMTFAVNEGDPGFAYATGCGGGLGLGACPPEGLQVTGQTTPAESTVIIWNECNPAKSVDSNGTAFNYSETYNSISSIYGWQDTVPTCAGGNPNNPDPNTLEYTMDVDTFLIDAETNPLFEEQFKKGDTSMFIKIGANRDVIYPNYMVVSVDTKAPRYDIPVNPATPTGREKNYCGCSEQSDAICPTAPFYFMIKVQNWGDDLSTNVTVQDTLSSKITYVPGTTEICKTWKSDNVCKTWKPVEDTNGGFPLANPYKVADVLGYCDQVNMTCDETIMLRFKVLPKEALAKNEVIENTAIINDDSGKAYKTNTSIPLRLTLGSCPSASLCENPDLTECGGYGSEGCEKDEECGAGKICKDGGCVIDESKFASDAKITVAEGKNTPVSDSAIIVSNPSAGLVMGQFSVMASSEEKDKNFMFESVTASVKNKNASTKLSNLKLIYDKNGNGIADEGEEAVAEANGVSTNTVTFALKSNTSIYPINEMHHFIMTADAKYESEDSIPLDTTFNFYLESIDSFKFSNIENMTAEMTETPINFAEYSFEPTVEAFIFTKTQNELAVPALSQMNKAPVSVLQIRAKSVANANSIKKIRIRTTSKSVKFMEGVDQIDVYLDVNKDGSADSEIKLASAIPASADQNLEIVFDQPIEFAANEEKILLFTAKFSIPKDQFAELEISNGKVTLSNSDAKVLGLPVKSKKFSFKCEEGDFTCNDTDDDDGGCALSAIDDANSSYMLYAAAAILAAIAAFLALRKRA